MEAAAPSTKSGREPPPVPPNYVSLRHLQELRLKEKEEQERRRREEEEAAAAAAAAAAKREAEEAARAAAIKLEAALKAEAKGRAASLEASGGAKEWHRGGKAQGQGHQWVAVAHRAPATPPKPMARGQGAAGKREAAIGGGHGEKGADDVPDNAPHGGGKPLVKGKGKWKGREKEKRPEAAPAPSHGGKPAEVVPASPYGGRPESKSESNAKGKAPGNQAAESGSSGGGPGEQADASISSSRNRFRRGRLRDPVGRSAETCTGVAPVKTAGPSPPRGVKSGDGMGKPKPPAPRRADAVAGGDSPDGNKTAPAQAPPPSAADGGSKPTSGGVLRKTMEAKPGGLVERQRRRQVLEAQAVAELNPRAVRCSAGGTWRGRGNEAAEQHGRVWVPKAAASGSSAGAEL